MGEKIKLQKKYVVQQNEVPPTENQYLTFDENGDQIAKTFETNFYPVLHVNTDENCDIKITNGKFSFESSYVDNKIFKPTDSDGVYFIRRGQSYLNASFTGKEFLIYRDNNYDIAIIDSNGQLENGSVKVYNDPQNPDVGTVVNYTASYVFEGGKKRTLITLENKITETNVLVDYDQIIGPLEVTGNDGDNDFTIPELGKWNIELYNNGEKIKPKDGKEISIDIDNINYYSIDIYPFQCNLIVKAPPGMTVICQKDDAVYYSDSYDTDKKGYVIQVLESGYWSIIVKSSLETAETIVEIKSTDNDNEKIINCTIHLVPDDVFGNNTWETISWASYTGNIPKDSQGNYKWKVGDFKEVIISDAPFEGTYRATIIGINHNSIYEGYSTIHLQLFKYDDGNRCITDLPMNVQYSNLYGAALGGYSGDYERFNWDKTYLYDCISNNNYFKLPKELWDVIRPSIKYTTRFISNRAYREYNYYNYPIKTQTKMFLLSPIEVGVDIAYSLKKDINQSVYEYYDNKKEQESVITNRRNLASDWWLRRPTAYQTTVGWGLVAWEYNYITSHGTDGGIQFIGPTGSAADPTYIKMGVSPCFVV